MKGSFTIESAIYVPMFFFIILAVIGTAVSLYQETVTVYEPAQVEQMWEVPAFYRYQQVEWAMEQVSVK